MFYKIKSKKLQKIRYFTLCSRKEDAKRRIFKRYRREVSQANTLSVLQNSVDLLRYCVAQRYEAFLVNENLIVFEKGH